MMRIARDWRVLLASAAVGVGSVAAVAGATASAEPVLPPQPVPVPAPALSPVPQPVAITPGAVANSMPATASPTLLPASAGTLRDYFQGKNVKLEPQQPQNFKALDITVPMPPRWTRVPDPNVPDAFVVIADRTGNASLYTSNAQVVVYKLVGDFDPREAITHGYVDSEQLPAWRTTNASLADFGGFPSSVIEGTYRQNDMTLNTSRRHVIATSGSERYLVSLAVTTAVSQAVADAPATDAIVNGFQVSAPAPAPSSTAARSGRPPATSH